ncbi:MAG: thioredoxin family protein [Stellaceae bacterium]
MTALSPFAVAGRAAFADIALAGEVDCLVVFGLAWSAIGKRLAERAQRVAGRHAVAALSIDVDAHPELARRCRVAAVPSLLLFRNGQEVERRIGEVSERDLDDWMTLALAED